MLKIEFTRPTIYMSHPIRGNDNNIERNCKKAKLAVTRLRRTFPEVDFYCPAEGDLTLQILTESNRLSVDDVMYADIQILKACHGYFWYDHQSSYGSVLEFDKAVEIGLVPENIKRVCFSYDIEKASYQVLRKDFTDIVDFTIKNFRWRNNGV